MADRFYLSEPVGGTTATLTGDEAHHLSRVMRAKPGDSIVLFDGYGNEYEATVGEVSKKCVTLEIVSHSTVTDPNDPEIIVACALPKGDRQKYLVEKLVELGANQLIPLKSKYSVAEANEKVVDRIRKQVIEASKQCRRSWLMKVESEVNIDTLLENFSDFVGSRLVADPYTATGSEVLLRDEAAVIAIGPEGGFSETESLQFTEGGWSPVCFSPNVLRVETAAAAAVAIARQSKFKKSRA